MPEDLMALLSEIRLQLSSLEKDVSQSKAASQENKSAFEQLNSDQGGGVPHIVRELTNSPYDLAETFDLVQTLGLMEEGAKDFGDSSLENRLSRIKERLERHFDALCQLSDNNLDIFSANTLPASKSKE